MQLTARKRSQPHRPNKDSSTEMPNGDGKQNEEIVTKCDEGVPQIIRTQKIVQKNMFNTLS